MEEACRREDLGVEREPVASSKQRPPDVCANAMFRKPRLGALTARICGPSGQRCLRKRQLLCSERLGASQSGWGPALPTQSSHDCLPDDVEVLAHGQSSAAPVGPSRGSDVHARSLTGAQSKAPVVCVPAQMNPTVLLSENKTY